MTHEPTPPALTPPDWEALARFHAGECSARESEAIAAWLAAHPEDAAVLGAVNEAASRLGDALRAPVDTEAALRRVLARRDAVAAVTPAAADPQAAVASLDAARARARERTVRTDPARDEQPIRRPSRRGTLVGAAAILLLAVGMYAWRSRGDGAQAAVVRVAAQVGALDSVMLRDGTQVVLGPGSTLTHAADYGTGSREVVLTGDGYFDVVRDDARPFTVRAGNAVIVDLSTAFVVRSDAGQGVTVAVTNGRVRVAPSGAASDALDLQQGESARVSDAAQPPVRDSVTLDDATAWRRGTLVFRDATLGEVSALLARWYGLTLQVDPALASRRITATFEQESGRAVLDVIALSLGAELQVNGDTASLGARAR